MAANRSNRIGLLGGTFNPVHIGHLILAQCAAETYELSRTLFVPCAVPPHKNGGALAASAHRLAMLQAALQDDLRFEISDIEIRRRGPSYSVETVAELCRRHPAAELFFIIGADSLRELHLWKDIYSLLSMCRFVAFGRPGVDVERVRPEDMRLDPPWPERLLRDLKPGRPVGVASSDIRRRVAEGMSIRYLVPRAVEMYIAEHGLYRL